MISYLFNEAIILCEGSVCGNCSPSGVVCVDSDIVKVKTGQSKVMSMLKIVDGNYSE